MATITKFRLQSAGSAYVLRNIGFEPDTIEVWNYTKWETDTKVVKSYWHKGMTAGYAINEICEDTGANRSISTSNGFTVASGSSIATGNQTVSGITAAQPPVVTVTSTTGWTTGDVVSFNDIGGMVQLNQNRYKITVIDGTTFSLQDFDGNNIDATGYTAFAAGTELNIANNLSIDTIDSGSWRVTLGTAVVGANDDILYVECKSVDDYTNLGDVA